MILIIDNYDSFTYNLSQYFQQLCAEVSVVRNDHISTDQINKLEPDLIILSPGPGTPEKAAICKEIVAIYQSTIPILGVCLGHQAIVEYYGGSIVKGHQPMHGKVTAIEHDQAITYRDVPSPAKVTRYHSLVANPADLPPCLHITATGEDGTIMGVRHRSYPVEGVQFHPESIMTNFGFQMLKNYYDYAVKWRTASKKEKV
ncbi:anthranilate synthase component II [Thalassobacillus pellis]|uniref:anthranilate synthase component II n=1 Tax=Thalassobacillus pellis TaxID=748008 RepID=UPI00195F880D|nr:aminodeoxychorismate/anthranilate synthase component II [Thalassobacillus pellis]MBM7552000.1 anthranilate synthase/aminodeoxychorismate synthase-like glutamine amidotransferase [Thalassobacillus pellis]